MVDVRDPLELFSESDIANLLAAIGRTHILAAFSLPDNPVRGRLVYLT